MKWDKTMKRVRQEKADANADSATDSGTGAVSNNAVANMLATQQGMSESQLGLLDSAWSGIDSTEELNGAVEHVETAHTKGILELAMSEFMISSNLVEKSMSDAEGNLFTAAIAQLTADSSAQSAGEKSLLQMLDHQSAIYESAMDALQFEAADKFRLPAGAQRIELGLKPRSTELGRADKTVEDDVFDAFTAVIGFNGAATATDAYIAVKPFMDESPGKKPYIIGACIEKSTHDLATTQEYCSVLCENFGVSEGRYAALFVEGLESVESDPDSEVGDLYITMAGMADILPKIRNGQFDQEQPIPTNMPKFAEHAGPLLAAYRLHAFLCDVTAVTDGMETEGKPIDTRDVNFAAEMLAQAQGLSATLKPAIGGFMTRLEGYSMSYSEAYPEMGTRLTAVSQSQYDNFGTNVMAPLNVQVQVLLAADGMGVENTDLMGMPTSADIDKMAKDIVKAAQKVDSSALGLAATAIGSPAFSNIVAFSQLNLKAMKLKEIHEAAKGRSLTTKEEWDELSTWADITKTCSGGLKYVTEFGAEKLTERSRTLWSNPATRGRAGPMRLHAIELGKAGQACGKLILVTEVISACASIYTLCDDTATVDEKIDAGISLAGAGVSIGGAFATGAMATTLNVAGLGIAYVQLIRSEFAKIKAIEKAGYAGLSRDAFLTVRNSMDKALVLSSRLAAGKTLLDPSKDLSDPENALVMTTLEKLAESTWGATHLIHSQCMDVTDTNGHVSEALVGWTGDQANLRQDYVSDVGNAPAKLEEAGRMSDYNDQIEALRNGGAGVFGAAGNLSEHIAFYYNLRTSD